MTIVEFIFTGKECIYLKNGGNTMDIILAMHLKVNKSK